MITKNIIRLDKNTKTIYTPTLTLMTRDFKPLGKISKYLNWNISLQANGVDEISFDVNKSYYDEYGNKITCPVWDNLIDLKIVDVDGLGKFEITVSYTDNAETIKSVHGQSLEVELGQVYLRDFHVNDEEAITGEITEYNKMHFDANGNFIPTVFYDPKNKYNSLLHRVLADKAPHWSIGYVTPYVTLGENEEAEKVEKFVRTYTVDGTDIYSFLTEDVAKETNVVFLFDTNTRTINCYSLEDCYVDGELVQKAIGEDTNVLISKKKLANEIGIESNKDDVKNCFRISGGDDLITSQIAAVNMTGSNYIYKFADFQLNDMPERLRNKIISYQAYADSRRDEYYGENGIYTELCNAYQELNYLKSEMMPDSTLKETNAEKQYEDIVGKLQRGVGMEDTNKSLEIVNNNVSAMAEVYCDSRYKVSLIKTNASYSPSTRKWKGQIQVVRTTDETDSFPTLPSMLDNTFEVPILTDSDNLTYTKQKLEKALAKNDMTSLNASFDEIEGTEQEIQEQIKEKLELYCLNMLKNFRDGYENCKSVLYNTNQYTTSTDTIPNGLYSKYNSRYLIACEVYDERKKEVDDVQALIDELTVKQRKFQDELNFPNYLVRDEDDGIELYRIFCSYIREDEYSNSNYISDGLETTKDLIDKAQELLDVAEAQLDKACILQRTVSVSLNNLLILPEFESLYDSFELFNYIRVRSEDELFKLRIISIEVSGENYADINVGFAERVEALDGKMSDLQSIVSQASAIASSYDSTMLQAKQGKQANNDIYEMSVDGINTQKYKVTNSNDNELTINSSGLLARKMTDEGVYSPKQLRITNNGMYLTDNNWTTIKEAIGEVKFSNGDVAYGIIADNIIGKFILGENLKISNGESSVIITGDYIKLGTIANGVTEEVPHPTGIELNKDGSVTFTSYSTGDFGAENSANLTFSLSDGLIISGTSYLPSSQGNTEWFDYTLRLSPKVDPSGTGDIIAFEGTDSHGLTTSWGIDRSGNIGNG